ncbi:MAG TPA: glycosyltransferase [Solirubrobacteraceae bacterium]|nr:glycosyltransferase [Solirubrobacteraceae bacterium]
MNVLYVAMRHEYGDPSRGLSFEETNFRSSLEGMGHAVTAYDFMESAARNGVARMRADLITLAAETRPELAFFFLFTDQLDTATIEAVGTAGRCPTVNWFADDHWRFEDFTRHFAPAFDLAVTTDADSLQKYRTLANTRVHLSQWACNRYAYSKVSDELKYDVTFVGQPHGDRKQAVARLRVAGLPVECWGFGWPAGPLEHGEMVDAFASSRINLNLSNSSPAPGINARIRRMLRFRPPPPRPAQIKGRNFEVPGCGGFLLTERVPHLEDYFELGREVGVFERAEDLADQIRYWLEHEDERQAVADAGYRRVMAEHTYDHRFAAIFAALDQ